MTFWELIIAHPIGGQWAPSAKFGPLAQTSSYATAHCIIRPLHAPRWRSVLLHEKTCFI